MRLRSRATALAVLSLCCASAQAALWQDLKSADTLGEPQIKTRNARVLTLDMDALQLQLAAAPYESEVRKGAKSALRLALPMPNGSEAEFRIQQTYLMHPDLAARYPQIKTYVGQGITDPHATLRLSVGPKGLHGLVLSPAGTVYMDPYRLGDNRTTQVYYKRDTLARESRLRHAPLLSGDQVLTEIGTRTPRTAGKVKASGTELRTYRLVMATTGEYFQFHSPPAIPFVGNPLADKTPVLEELVNVVNRVTGIYEREIAVRLELQPQTENVMFASALVDPYLDNDPVGIIAPLTMVQTNSLVLNLLAGSANYDVGHVASTGGGGIAGLGVVCGTDKGAGVTGLPEPIGDAYYVDYVAHEMGHQFGGNHTFNSELGSCGGNGNPSTAYEPGSGSTIQAYAGICGDDDLQPHSDDYFHGISFDEMVSFTTTGGGNGCAAITSTSNQPPTADAGAAYTIPKGTPFKLTGAGSDADGDALTYQWEEFDIGPFGPINTDNGDAPIFRSFNPTTSPSRIFPRWEDLLSNTQGIGEILPMQERVMSFRFNVRDNAVLRGAGGVEHDFTEVTVAASGPFKVTSPNTAQGYATGAELEVTWDVAGSDQPPVNCAAVDIDLISEGGMGEAKPLAAGVANNGSYKAKLPGAALGAARLRVSCSDNIFFDVADADITVGSGAKNARFGGALAPALLLMLGAAAFVSRRRRC